MAIYPSVNFTCLAFKEFINSSRSRLELIFKVKNAASFSSEELLHAVWNYCVTNNLDPLEYNSVEEIELTKANPNIYLTGYEDIQLTKEQAFALTTKLQEDYKGLVNLNLVFTQRTYPISRYLTQELHRYTFSSFLALFTVFGLHLKSNKDLLYLYLDKLDIDYSKSNSEYFFDIAQNNEFAQNLVLNLILNKFRKEKLTDKQLDYDKVLELFKRSVSSIRQYNLLGKLLGVLPSTLRGCKHKPYSTYVLDRFVNLFKITEEQINDANFIVHLNEELKTFVEQTPEDKTIINTRVSVPSSKITEVLTLLYYSVLHFVGGEFLEENGISRSSVKRTLRKQTSPFNFCYRLLELLDIHENDEYLNILFASEDGVTITPSEINETYLIEPETYSPLKALAKLNSLPQHKQIFYKKLDLSFDGNDAGKFPTNYPTYLYEKLKTQFKDTIKTNVCIVTQLLATDEKIFKDEQVIALSLGEIFTLHLDNHLVELKKILKDPTYVFLVSQVGNVEFSLLSLNESNESTIIFHDYINDNLIMYQQDLKAFLKYFEKVIVVYDVDYI